MAVTAITPVALAQATRSGDLVGIGTVASVVSDGWAISNARGADEMIIVLEADASGDTVTFLAGDRPPAQESALGNLSIVLAASDLRVVRISTARFMQNDGTILATCTDTGTTMYVLTINPRGH